MSSSLLPDNAQPYEIAIADANDSYGRLHGLIPQIPHIGRDLFPDGWLPWLMRNAGLELVMAHVPEAGWPTVYQQRAWLYIRGTGRAHVQAQSWIGFAAVYRDGPVDTDFYDWFDLILDRMPLPSELERVVGLGFAAKATASIFHRVVYRLDAGPVRPAHARYGSSVWSRWSGVAYKSGWPKLSLRPLLAEQGASNATEDGGGAVVVTIAAQASPEHHIRYGFSVRCRDAMRQRRAVDFMVLLGMHGDAQDAAHSRLAPPYDLPVGTRPLLDGDAAETVPPSPDESDRHIRYGYSRRDYDPMETA